MRKEWSYKEMERARAMARAGRLSVAEIAAELGRTPSSVGHVVAGHYPRRGMRTTATPRYRRAYVLRESGMTWAAIARDLGLSRATGAAVYARRYAESNGLRWPIDVTP